MTGVPLLRTVLVSHPLGEVNVEARSSDTVPGLVFGA